MIVDKIPVMRDLNRRLMGEPDSTLTAILIAGAVVLVLIALLASPVTKAAAAAWLIFP